MAAKGKVGWLPLAWWAVAGASSLATWYATSDTDTPRYESDDRKEPFSYKNGNGKPKNKWLAPAIVGGATIIAAILLLRKRR